MQHRPSMTKKHFIALADLIREHNEQFPDDRFTSNQLESLHRFCRRENWAFNADRWDSYIRGECGPSGGRRD
jgi:hypothetical protein